MTYVDSPFSSRSVSLVGLLLSFSPIHAHSSLILARCLFSHLRAACFGPAARSASAHSAQQSRCTHAEAQAALSFHPPSTPSSLSLIRLYSHPRPPSPCSLARLGALRVEVEQNYLLLYLFGPKAHCRTAGADSLSVPLAAWLSLASASPSGSISDLADRLPIHDFAAVNGACHRRASRSSAFLTFSGFFDLTCYITCPQAQHSCRSCTAATCAITYPASRKMSRS